MKQAKHSNWVSVGSRRILALGLILGWLAAGHEGWAARFAERIRYQQPSGVMIELQGFGNEHQAVYETLDGFTVVFVPEFKAYFYASLSPSGEELVSTGLEVGKDDPQTIGLAKGVRVNPETAQARARQVRQAWEDRLRLPERWATLRREQSPPRGVRQQALRYSPTVGTRCGLTLLIDFDDTKGTVARSSVVQFLNGDNYRGNSNKGSVKEYFADVSNGKLIYTNLVIGYIRIPGTVHPRSYYNDLNRVGELPTNELIRDAIIVLTNQPNYMTEIVPQLEALSVNDAGEVLALNVFVAGADSGVWSKGLWPHMNALFSVGPQELWPGGRKVNLYQMTTITFQSSPLQIGTFCHETGHLLCGFPDIYDYDSQSAGGAGQFCLMNSTPNQTNPQHLCAYLKFLAGWATVTDLAPGPARELTLSAPGTNGFHFLRYSPLFGREYYLIENRQKTGRDADIPGSGILVWHIDELGNNSNENLLPNSIHANYEVTLVQADGRWDLQKNQNVGDANDPFFKGNPSARYANRFADDTNPGASWWSGKRSGLELREFSAKGREMTLTAEVRPPSILRDPLSQSVNAGDDLFLSVQMATNYVYTYSWLKGGVPLLNEDRVSGVEGPALGIYSVASADAGNYSVVITDSAGHSETSRVAQITISNLRRLASADLGDSRRLGGATTILNNAFQIVAGGSGMLGAADGCRFLSEPVTGDFDAKLQVVDVNPEDGFSSLRGGVGLMVRNGLEAGSAQASVLVRPGWLDDGYVQALARTSQSTPLNEVALGGGVSALNGWVRLKREGSLVSMYSSTNGTRWDWLKTVNMSLDPGAVVGIAASSFDPVLRIVTGVKSYSLLSDSPPTFAISSRQNSALEGADAPATLTVVSSRNGPLEVPYSIKDTSANGVLYEKLSGQLSLPAGTNVALLEIVPINNLTASPPAVVTISLPSSGVIQSSANAILFDDDELGHGLKREFYPGIAGTAVSDLTGSYRYPGSVQLGTVLSFESSLAQGAGQILSGYLTPPTSGAYTFYLASANASELWLSTDASPANAVKIAEERGTNTKRNWAGYGSTSHISPPIQLSQGRWYSVKALHKAGLGTPHLAVAWHVPGGDVPQPGSGPIGGEHLTWALPPETVPAGGILRLTSSASGQLLLTVEAVTTVKLALEASSDLVHWQTVSANLAPGELNLRSLDDSSAREMTRFYRVIAR